MAVFLVRHAAAGDRFDWDGPDRLRPLTARGGRQAQGLVGALEGQAVERILTSPFTRCVATVEPLGAARGVAVEAVDELAEGRSPLAIELAESLIGVDAVLCSHGDVIPEIVWALARRHRLDIPAPLHMRCEKGSTWVVHTDGTAFVSAEYLPPPA